MNGEKQKFIGGIDFDELKAQRVQLYNAITINLATARTNEEMVFTGNYIYALEATDVDANVDIRFNELFRAAINIKKGRGVRIPFYRFYLTNTAQAGKSITLAIGIEASDFEVFDVGKALEITGINPVYQAPQTGGVQVAKDGVADGAVTTVIYTVTAGKTFKLCHANISHYISEGTDTGELQVTNAADVVQYRIFNIITNTLVSISNTMTATPPIEIPAGYKIKVVGTANTFVRAFIFGYEI